MSERNHRPSVNGHLPKSTSVQPKPVDPLFAAYDELNAWWAKAEANLAALKIPAEVRVSLGGPCYFGPPDDAPDGCEEEFLSWWRHKGEVRICWSKETSWADGERKIQTKPILECPLETRVEMAQHFGRLREKMRHEKDKYLPRVKDAIQQLKGALEE